MARIGSDFPYDAFKAVLSSRRSSLLERFIGDPSGTSPEDSIQGVFERIHGDITLLPTLLDPDGPKTQLRYLAWQLGWDDTDLVRFIDRLDDTLLRRVMALSTPLWSAKGSDTGILGSIQAFLGRRALLFNWFHHQLVLDDSGLWAEGLGSDPFLVGGVYTEEDEDLFHIVLNRGGLDTEARRLLYEFLTYIRVAGEHMAVIYAAFADNFLGGLSQWESLGPAGSAYDIDGQYEVYLTQDAEIRTRVPLTEGATWGPSQQLRAKVVFATASETTEGIVLAGFRDDVAGTNKYQGLLGSEGAVFILRNGIIFAASLTAGAPFLPLPGTPFEFAMTTTAINAGQSVVALWVNGEKVLERTFLGLDVHIDPSGGASIGRVGSEASPTIVKEFIVLASPYRVQYVGQKKLTPTIGPGGTEYIADPDPGLEPFVG